MNYQVKTGSAASQSAGCLIIPVSGKSSLAPSASALSDSVQKQLQKLIKRGDLGSGIGKTLMLHDLPELKAHRLLLVHTGDKTLNAANYIKTIKAVLSGLASTGSKDAVLTLADFDSVLDAAGKTRLLVELVADRQYSFTQMKSKKPDAPTQLEKFVLFIKENSEKSAVESAVAQGLAIGKGKEVAKTLGNLPGNICTPTYLAEQAKSLAKNYTRLTTQVLDEKKMAELGMHSLLSVSAGSAEPAKLIVMKYNGGKRGQAPQVLVGKGITFDTGGISLKPGAAMDEMKFDMCGAASVFGTVTAACELELPINLIGIVASAENMPGSKATKPGDIVTSMAGLTIEILNTDAEGRLVLCDALTYAEQFKPAAIVDIATLTGACIIALGHDVSGMMSNNDELAQELLAASQTSQDKAWQLPLWDEYQPLLDSNFADIANIGGRPAGTITAACFLSRFTEKQRWAHLDVAGTAWFSGKNKGASGRPVPLLTQYLIDRCNDNA